MQGQLPSTVDDSAVSPAWKRQSTEAVRTISQAAQQQAHHARDLRASPAPEAVQVDERITAIHTADELVTALESGATHIVVQAHLDFTSLDDGIRDKFPISVVPNSVRTIRVRLIQATCVW